MRTLFVFCFVLFLAIQNRTVTFRASCIWHSNRVFQCSTCVFSLFWKKIHSKWIWRDKAVVSCSGDEEYSIKNYENLTCSDRSKRREPLGVRKLQDRVNPKIIMKVTEETVDKKVCVSIISALLTKLETLLSDFNISGANVSVSNKALSKQLCDLRVTVRLV